MHIRETVIVNLRNPTKRKWQWLETMANAYSQAVQFALDAAQRIRTSSRTKIHNASYYAIRNTFGLPSDYTRMAVNAAVSMARSYYGLRKSKVAKRVSFPKVNGSQGIGLGIDSYRIFERDNGFVLRVSTGKRGQYMWFPLSVPARYREKIQFVKGDAKLFERRGKWYVMFPLRIPSTPAVCDGEPTFIGVDLGIVKIATVAPPDGVVFFCGKEARHKREHYYDIRRRYQRHNRSDRVKAHRGKETRWMTDLNHKISKQIVDIALRYDNSVIVFESLDGIRNRVRGSKRFNRMMSSWSFRQLVDFVRYKAERQGVRVIFIDPRGTSKTCSRCGHSSRSNRPNQASFRCVSCGYRANADANAAINIARRGFDTHGDGPPDTARPNSRTGDTSLRPDVVKDDAPRHQTTTSSGSRGTSSL